MGGGPRSRPGSGGWRCRKEVRKIKDEKDWIEEQNKKIIHWLWIIFVSMITALLTTIALTV